MTRVKRVTGYWRLIPDPLATDPHAEMLRAFQRDRRLEELPDEIAAEMDREFYVELS